ncbi:hypothetical protein EON63_11010 [archaeon]|nr:MAG: hypothetical protein EON63_11010 [archaeon]
MERELVFDIDMTDYDDIRTCCKGAEICMRLVHEHWCNHNPIHTLTNNITYTCVHIHIIHIYRCWPYMTMAMKVVDVTLKEDFGFKHVAWVYSGKQWDGDGYGDI